MKLEEPQTGARLRGLTPDGAATVKSVQWVGDQSLKVSYRDGQGQLIQQLVYRDSEPTPELVETGRPWSFDGGGEPLRLVSEAYPIRVTRLFDPYMAITTSVIEPLRHQISAVYIKDFDYGHPEFAQTSSTFALEALLHSGGPPA